MAPDRNNLAAALASVFSRNESGLGQLAAIRRETSPYVTTFPCEVVTCRFVDGGKLRLFCKYAARDGKCSHGQRGGVRYEAAVYRRVLQPSGATAPVFHGSYTDRKTGGTWLILEHVGRSLRVGKMGLRAMLRAARWIGEFHAANEARAPRLRFLTAYGAAYYRGWPRRASRLAHRLGLRLPWLPALSKRLEREVATLADLPRTVIHGEYYPHNVLYQAGVVRPVDWETAAVAPGEIDLATLTEGWGPELSRALELEYQRARWPMGPPSGFLRSLDLARTYMQLRWLGDDDPKWTANMSRWAHLHALSQRLELI
jgi:aminoglycoside phosphotransferase (APT) family kinase protein